MVVTINNNNDYNNRFLPVKEKCFQVDLFACSLFAWSLCWISSGGSLLLNLFCWISFAESLLLDLFCRISFAGSLLPNLFCRISFAESLLVDLFAESLLLDLFCGISFAGSFCWISFVGSFLPDLFCWISFVGSLLLDLFWPDLFCWFSNGLTLKLQVVGYHGYCLNENWKMKFWKRSWKTTKNVCRKLLILQICFCSAFIPCKHWFIYLCYI